MANWLSSFFAPEFEGKALQKSGTISKEQLLSFFEHGKELFDNPDFKMALARVSSCLVENYSCQEESLKRLYH